MIITTAGNYPRTSDRPGGQALRRALAQLDEGRIDWAGVRHVQDEVIVEVIKDQVGVGLDVVTDGLVRWDDAVTYIARGLGSFEMHGIVRYLDTNTFYREPLASGRIRWKEPITVADWQYAASVSERPVKAVLTGPFTVARLSRSAVHGNSDDLVLELADALREEIDALHRAGAPVVQIDEPVIAKRAGDWPIFQEAMRRLTRGTTGRLELNVHFGGVEGLPDLFHLPFHVYGLDLIQGPGNWEILDRIPLDREVRLGVVDAREVRLEGASDIAGALERAARFVAPERMHVSPNCGLEFLPRDSALAKLRRTAEGAHLFMGVGSRQ